MNYNFHVSEHPFFPDKRFLKADNIQIVVKIWYFVKSKQNLVYLPKRTFLCKTGIYLCFSVFFRVRNK